MTAERFENRAAMAVSLRDAVPSRSFLGKIRSLSEDVLVSGAVGTAVNLGIRAAAQTVGLGVVAGGLAGAGAGATRELAKQYKEQNDSNLFKDILKMKFKGMEVNKGRLASSAVIGGVSGAVGGPVVEWLAQSALGHAVTEAAQGVFSYAAHLKDEAAVRAGGIAGGIWNEISAPTVASAQAIRVEDRIISGVAIEDVQVTVVDRPPTTMPVIEDVNVTVIDRPPIMFVELPVEPLPAGKIIDLPSELPLEPGSNPYATSRALLEGILGKSPSETDIMEVTKAFRERTPFSIEEWDLRGEGLVDAKDLQPGFKFIIDNNVSSVVNKIAANYLVA